MSNLAKKLPKNLQRIYRIFKKHPEIKDARAELEDFTQKIEADQFFNNQSAEEKERLQTNISLFLEKRGAYDVIEIYRDILSLIWVEGSP